MKDLIGRRAIVSGGARGIGLAVAQRLAAGGASVAIADVDQDGARVAATSLGNGSIGVRCRVIDAALGVVEYGTWNVNNCVNEQPWLPNGPVPLAIDSSAPGYVRRQTLTSGESRRVDDGMRQ